MAAAVNYQIGDKQLLVDGDMEMNNTTNWTGVNGGVITKVTASPVSGKQNLRITKSIANSLFGTSRQTVTSAGKRYRITGWGRGDGTIVPRVESALDSYVWLGTSSATWQHFDVLFVPGTFVGFAVGAGGGIGNYVEFDDVYVTEYQGKEQIFEKQLLADGSMEKSGITGWSQDNGGVVTKVTASPVSGKQNLRITKSIANSLFGTSRQTVTSAGKRYRITGWGRGDGTIVPRVESALDSYVWLGTSSATWQHFDVLFVPGTFVGFAVGAGGGIGNYVEFDDVYVTEYQGKEQIFEKQLLADGSMEGTNGPVALVDGNMEAAGTGSWSGGGSETLAKIAGNLSGVGSQYLRITQTAPTPTAFQTMLTNGHSYHITGWARGDGTANPFVSSNDSSMAWTGTNSATPQYFDYTAGYTGVGQFRLWCKNGGNGNYCDFDDITITDVTAGSWSAGGSAVLSKQTTTPHGGRQALRVTYNGTANPYAFQSSILTNGKKYRFTGWARGDGVGIPSVYFADGTNIWTGTTSVSWQRFDVTMTATNVTLMLYSSLNSAGYIEFDDVYVTQLP